MSITEPPIRRESIYSGIVVKTKPGRGRFLYLQKDPNDEGSIFRISIPAHGGIHRTLTDRIGQHVTIKVTTEVTFGGGQ